MTLDLSKSDHSNSLIIPIQQKQIILTYNPLISFTHRSIQQDCIVISLDPAMECIHSRLVCLEAVHIIPGIHPRNYLNNRSI
jgi:hypothetical protein